MYFIRKAETSYLSPLVLAFIVLATINSNAQLKIDVPFYVKAKLIDAKTNDPVVFANVINTKSGVGVISDSSGIFLMLAKPGDMLQVTSIGYQPRLFMVHDSMRILFYLPRIKLIEKIYELGHVDVHFLGTYEQFKYRMIHAKTSDPMAGLNKEIRKAIDSIASMPTSDLPTFSLGSPVTALYMAFSKEGKQLRKYREVKEQEPSLKIVDTKFNREVLANVTGLKGEELNEFALYCKLSDAFIIKASEYELVEKILEIYGDFKKQKASPSDKKASQK
jgi:hypothetical protein